jgi:hypothetical protein
MAAACASANKGTKMWEEEEEEEEEEEAEKESSGPNLSF